LPGFSFGQMQMIYANGNANKNKSLKVEYVYGELPFHIRYKSHPYKDMRVYVFGGFKYSFYISSKSRGIDVKLNITASVYLLYLKNSVLCCRLVCFRRDGDE